MTCAHTKTSSTDDDMNGCSKTHADALEDRYGPPMVLPRIADSTPGKNGEERRPRRRRTALVPTRRRGLVLNLVSRGPDSPAQISVFAVEKEALIEAIEGLEERPANEHTGPRDPIGRSGLLVGRGVSDRLVCPGRLRKHAVQKQSLGVRRTQTRKSALGERQRSFGVDDPRTDRSDVRRPLQDIDQAAERVGVDPCVRIQEQDER